MPEEQNCMSSSNRADHPLWQTAIDQLLWYGRIRRITSWVACREYSQSINQLTNLFCCSLLTGCVLRIHSLIKSTSLVCLFSRTFLLAEFSTLRYFFLLQIHQLSSFRILLHHGSRLKAQRHGDGEAATICACGVWISELQSALLPGHWTEFPTAICTAVLCAFAASTTSNPGRCLEKMG